MARYRPNASPAVHEDPLFLSAQQPDFDQHIHLAVPLAGLADDLAEFLVAPFRFLSPVDRAVNERKILGEEFA